MPLIVIGGMDDVPDTSTTSIFRDNVKAPCYESAKSSFNSTAFSLHESSCTCPTGSIWIPFGQPSPNDKLTRTDDGVSWIFSVNSSSLCFSFLSAKSQNHATTSQHLVQEGAKAVVLPCVTLPPSLRVDVLQPDYAEKLTVLPNRREAAKEEKRFGWVNINESSRFPTSRWATTFRITHNMIRSIRWKILPFVSTGLYKTRQTMYKNRNTPCLKRNQRRGYVKNKNGLPGMCVGAKDNCRLCLARPKVLDSWRCHQRSGVISGKNKYTVSECLRIAAATV